MTRQAVESKNNATVISRVTYYSKFFHKRGFERRSDFPVCQSCKELQDAGITDSGLYIIYPDHQPEGFTVECDMETDGGGWTRMTSLLGSLSGATWDNADNIIGYNKPTNCGSYNARNFLFENIRIPWEETRFDFSREESIMQCARFVDYANGTILPEMRSFRIENDGAETSWDYAFEVIMFGPVDPSHLDLFIRNGDFIIRGQSMGRISLVSLVHAQDIAIQEGIPLLYG